MTRWAVFVVAIGFTFAVRFDAAAQEPPAEPLLPDRPWEVIEVAILLDVSDSMEGLIDTTRIKLWDLVNELALAEPSPRLRVALVSFGHRDSPAARGWVNIETDFTEDLDRVSERLFSLSSDGSVEYVGRVLDTALGELTWTDAAGPLKLIFIAGNESADQDPEIGFRAVSEKAFGRGIELHAIFCGSPQGEHAAGWREVAELGRGQFATVNHGQGPVVVETPFDEELAELGAALNETFVPFGEGGKARLENQRRQDRNARRAGLAVAASRAQAKSSPIYTPEWDLVKAVAEERVVLHQLKDSELPPGMRHLSFDEVYSLLEELRLERGELRRRIAELGRQRSEHVAEQLENRVIDDSRAFDTVLRRTVRRRAEESGFTFQR